MAQHYICINDSTGSDDGFIYWELRKLQMKKDYAETVFVCVLSVIEIPIMILTLIALCFLVKSRPAASVFVSNLILSDLMQVICMLIIEAATSWTQILFSAYDYSLIVGLYFMACIAFERYLLVSHPVWSRSHHSLKLSCFISVIIWLVPLTIAKVKPPCIFFEDLHWCIACLIPFPIIILCFAGTWRGLSHTISLTALQRKLILGSLFLVLLTYTLLILPFVIMLIIENFFPNDSFVKKCLSCTEMLMYVNPLADCFLYLFMRPDVRNMMKSIRCCCRRQRSNHSQDEHSVVNPQNSCSTVVCCISAEKPASQSLNTCSSV